MDRTFFPLICSLKWNATVETEQCVGPWQLERERDGFSTATFDYNRVYDYKWLIIMSGHGSCVTGETHHCWEAVVNIPGQNQVEIRESFGSVQPPMSGGEKKSSVPATGKSVQLLYGRCSKHVQTAWSSQMSKGALDEHPSTIFGWLSPPSWGPQFLWWVKRRAGIPSGKQPHNYGKSLFLMGKSTISMAIFHSYVCLPEGTWSLADCCATLEKTQRNHLDVRFQQHESSDFPIEGWISKGYIILKANPKD